jgi:Holliday junction DNA helicase RuvA
MIRNISGKIIDSGASYVVVMTGGIGYKVHATLETIANTANKETISLFTYLSIREDSHDLYGFEDRDSLDFFELLLTVSGIGPKSALAILNVATAKALKSAIASGDSKLVTKTTGIGTKRAEKIILELKDKLSVQESDIKGHREMEDAAEALVALGYSRKEAVEALKNSNPGSHKTEDRIKEALKVIGK